MSPRSLSLLNTSQNERRERLIILSRSITQLSKKLIFHLHRGATSPPHQRIKTINEGKGKEREILANFGKIRDELGRGQDASSFWRWARPVSPGMEEYIEATSFLYYLDTGRLISLQEVQNLLSDQETGDAVGVCGLGDIWLTGSMWLSHRRITSWACRISLGSSCGMLPMVSARVVRMIVFADTQL